VGTTIRSSGCKPTLSLSRSSAEPIGSMSGIANSRTRAAGVRRGMGIQGSRKTALRGTDGWISLVGAGQNRLTRLVGVRYPFLDSTAKTSSYRELAKKLIEISYLM